MQNPSIPFPESMAAAFTPPNSYTLQQYAKVCGFDGFDWQQQITYLPDAVNVTPNIPADVFNNVFPLSCSDATSETFHAPYTCSLVAGLSDFQDAPFPPLFDPPKGGYTYLKDNPYLFYYLWAGVKNAQIGWCALETALYCPVVYPFIISADQKTLTFLYIPVEESLSGEAPSISPNGRYMALTTSLVGVSLSTQNPTSQLCDPTVKTGPYCTPLYTWTSNTTNNGEACDGILSALGKCSAGGVSQTATEFPFIPGSGTGGASLVTVNGLEPQTATPILSFQGGTFDSPISVGITGPTAGASIYYTTNGTTPTSTSTLYNGPISVDSSKTIEAIAIATNYTPSNLTTATYQIAEPASSQTVLTVLPASGMQGTIFTLQASITSEGTHASKGSVSFYDGSTLLETAQVKETTGIAALKTASLLPGTNRVEAKFDLPPFSHPFITRDSVFGFGFEIESQPPFLLWKCGKRSLLSTFP